MMLVPEYSPQADELLSQQVIDNPHRLYQRVREQTPLARVGDCGVHLVASWALIAEVLEREADFSANLTGVLIRDELGQPSIFDLSHLGAAANVIATADEPDHGIHRALLQPYFKSSVIADLQAPVTDWVQDALAPLLRSGGGDVIPLVEKIPALVVAHLLGLPKNDVDYFRTWAMMGGDMLAGEVSIQDMMALGQESARMSAYLGEHFDLALKKLSEDGDASQSTVMQLLAQAVQDQTINRQQALGIATVLFGAGGESTAALIGMCLLRLAQDIETADLLRDQPQLIPRFIEEIIRLEPPFKFHYRVVRRDCRLNGYTLKKNDRLMLLWAAANRDASEIEQPDTLLLDRKHSKRHMGFGRGAHFCIGAVLARLEAKIVLEQLLEATTSIALADRSPQFASSIFIRRLTSLELLLK